MSQVEVFDNEIINEMKDFYIAYEMGKRRIKNLYPKSKEDKIRRSGAFLNICKVILVRPPETNHVSKKCV